jgi:hypothetical protein
LDRDFAFSTWNNSHCPQELTHKRDGEILDILINIQTNEYVNKSKMNEAIHVKWKTIIHDPFLLNNWSLISAY